MARTGWLVAALCTAVPCAGAGQGRPLDVSARAPLRLEASATAAAPVDRVCSGGPVPAALADPSAGLFLARQPGAQQDAQTLSLATLRPLFDLRIAAGSLRLFVLGSPLRRGLAFSTAGWRPRWPLC